ncbi:MAG: hypothetical protein JWR85_3542, partial [Marmoricola sp.]|nr:hypothetical protein [Marmoricola sp.]
MDEGQDALMSKILAAKQQPGEGVKDFGNRMRAMVGQLNQRGDKASTINEEVLVKSFTKGLYARYRFAVQSSHPRSLAEAIDTAESLVELEDFAYQQPSMDNTNKFNNQRERYCGWCHTRGHQERDCNKKNSDSKDKRQGQDQRHQDHHYNNNNNNNNSSHHQRRERPPDGGSGTRNGETNITPEKQKTCYFVLNQGTCHRGAKCKYIHEHVAAPVALPQINTIRPLLGDG